MACDVCQHAVLSHQLAATGIYISHLHGHVLLMLPKPCAAMSDGTNLLIRTLPGMATQIIRDMMKVGCWHIGSRVLETVPRAMSRRSPGAGGTPPCGRPPQQCCRLLSAACASRGACCARRTSQRSTGRCPPGVSADRAPAGGSTSSACCTDSEW